MSDQIDLFAAEEPKTCDTCGECMEGATGQYCALSLRGFDAGRKACWMWHARRER